MICNSKLMVSVVVPCFNTGHLINKCIESLINQTFKNIEIILVDDGSTDNTFDVLTKFAFSDERIKVIQQDNAGIAYARFFGASKATSDIITFVDSDDFIDLNCIEDAVECFSKGADGVLYSLAYEYIDGRKCIPFTYQISFPLTGNELIAATIPSWKSSTNGFFNKEAFFNAFKLVTLVSTNSDEVIQRLVYKNLLRVDKISSNYYYVQYPDSTSKSPKLNFISRLDTAYWMRCNVFNKEIGVPVYGLYLLHLNELIHLINKYEDNKRYFSDHQKKLWINNIRKHVIVFFSFDCLYPVNIKKYLKLAYSFAWFLRTALE